MATKKGKEEVFVLSSLTVNIKGCEKKAYVLRALLHPLRQKFLQMMDKAKDKRINVTTIYNKLNLEQSVASQHLAILRRAGLVLSAKQSREVFYSVNYPALTELNASVAV